MRWTVIELGLDRKDEKKALDDAQRRLELAGDRAEAVKVARAELQAALGRAAFLRVVVRELMR
jgi:hypothetical protein